MLIFTFSVFTLVIPYKHLGNCNKILTYFLILTKCFITRTNLFLVLVQFHHFTVVMWQLNFVHSTNIFLRTMNKVCEDMWPEFLNIQPCSAATLINLAVTVNIENCQPFTRISWKQHCCVVRCITSTSKFCRSMLLYSVSSKSHPSKCKATYFFF